MPLHHKKFPFYLAALVATFIVFLAWSARQATTNGARITDRDYYSKGLRYNTSQVERQAAKALGWQVNSHLEQRRIRLTVTDSDHQPVVAAAIALTLLLPAGEQRIALAEASPGTYQAELPKALNGEIPARYAISSQGARIERQLLINLGR